MLQPEWLSQAEAILFAAGEPLTSEKIAAVLEITADDVTELMHELAQTYADNLRGIQLRKVAGGYQLVTKPSLLPIVQRLIEAQTVKLSNAAMETLAIIAFKQPVTRSEMEAIRGVKVDGVVNTLLEVNLIEEAGRKDTIGHPITYATTQNFLTTFGLDSVKDLLDLPEEILTPQEEAAEVAKAIDGEAVLSEPLFSDAEDETTQNELIAREEERITKEAADEPAVKTETKPEQED